MPKKSNLRESSFCVVHRCGPQVRSTGAVHHDAGPVEASRWVGQLVTVCPARRQRVLNPLSSFYSLEPLVQGMVLSMFGVDPPYTIKPCTVIPKAVYPRGV